MEPFDLKEVLNYLVKIWNKGIVTELTAQLSFLFFISRFEYVADVIFVNSYPFSPWC